MEWSNFITTGDNGMTSRNFLTHERKKPHNSEFRCINFFKIESICIKWVLEYRKDSIAMPFLYILPCKWFCVVIFSSQQFVAFGLPLPHFIFNKTYRRKILSVSRVNLKMKLYNGMKFYWAIEFGYNNIIAIAPVRQGRVKQHLSNSNLRLAQLRRFPKYKLLNLHIIDTNWDDVLWHVYLLTSCASIEKHSIMCKLLGKSPII